MDAKNNLDLKIYAAGLRDDLPQLDLHDLLKSEIEIQIDQFIYQCYKKQESAVRIICGMGEGVLLAETMRVLANHPLVLGSIEEGGSCLVIVDI